MFSRFVTRYFNSTHKHLHPTEMIAKMKDLRHHIKQHEEEIAALNKQVRDMSFRSKRKKWRLTRRIKLYMRSESDWLKISKKQSSCGSMPRRKARSINQQPFRSSLQVSSDLELTSITQNHWSTINIQQIWDRDLTIQWDSSSTLYKSLKLTRQSSSKDHLLRNLKLKLSVNRRQKRTSRSRLSPRWCSKAGKFKARP